MIIHGIIFAGPGFEILEYQLVSIELMILLPQCLLQTVPACH